MHNFREVCTSVYQTIEALRSLHYEEKRELKLARLKFLQFHPEEKSMRYFIQNFQKNLISGK